LSVRGDGVVAEDGGATVVESYGVVGKPGGKGFTATSRYGLREAAIEFHEKNDAG
jgi:hypothetical protein